MANHNNGKYIAEAIQSATCQTLRDFELIIVDDYSSDNSITTIKELGRIDERIRLLPNKRREGVARTKNKGLKAARGEYVCMLDSDDLFKPTRLEKMVETLRTSAHSVAYTDIYRIDYSGRLLRASCMGTGHFLTEVNSLGNALASGWIWGANTFMFPSSALATVGFIDETLKWASDTAYLLRFLREYAVCIIPEALYGYRAHPWSRTSRVSPKEKAVSNIKVLESQLEENWNTLDTATKYKTIKHIVQAANEYKIVSKSLKWSFNPIYLKHKFEGAKGVTRRRLLFSELKRKIHTGQ
jgi:teichuronic acid biosynthesis glycosyltransferase TuaG